MKEIRLHGRGGQGVVKASQIVVKAVVQEKKQGQFIPFFGVERKGSPVFGYLRISQQPIRRKMQVYEPDILMILDDSLVVLPATYEGLKEGGTIIMNTVKPLEELKIPSQAAWLWWMQRAFRKRYLEEIYPILLCLEHLPKLQGLWTRKYCSRR